LQEVLKEFKLVPLVVGEVAPVEVAEVLEKLWGGSETLIVVSSDLSHYHDYETACQIDKLTSKAIEECRLQDIRDKQACGRNPINGLLYVARDKQMQIRTIDLRNSGDTAGSKQRVVGYGSYLFR
jgi:AmmeMemoRadiSam system protein B